MMKNCSLNKSPFLRKLNIVSVAGGLGNQMFQHAFYLGLKYYWYPKDFNRVFIAQYELHNGYELDTVFGIKNYLIINFIVGFIKKYFKRITYKEQERFGIGFVNLRVTHNMPIQYFSGYWQSDKYFTKIENIIRTVFSFDINKVSDQNKSIIFEMQRRNAVSLHIRRGDYESNPDAKLILGGICDMNYYNKCISYIHENVEDPFFYIFSDDSEWVKEHLSFILNSKFIDWNRNENCWQDMFLMSQCSHNIIANSSFSWWGAWLNSNPNKIVIGPVKWFNTNEVSDILPENWIRI